MSTAGEISGTGKRIYSEPNRAPRYTEDFYTEPAWTVDLLLDEEEFQGSVWDPACGSGTIPKAFARHMNFQGNNLFASDIVDRGYGWQANFLATIGTHHILAADNIVTNPPYRLAEEFVRRALELARQKVAVLVQSKFLFSQKRYRLFTEHPPTRIYFLSTRPSMPPGDLLAAGEIEAKGGKVDYLWIVIDKSYQGPTTAHWLLRK